MENLEFITSSANSLFDAVGDRKQQEAFLLMSFYFYSLKRKMKEKFMCWSTNLFIEVIFVLLLASVPNRVRHLFFNPLDHVCGVGVDPRFLRTGAPVPPAHDTNQCPTPIHFAHKRTSRIALKFITPVCRFVELHFFFQFWLALKTDGWSQHSRQADCCGNKWTRIFDSGALRHLCSPDRSLCLLPRTLHRSSAPSLPLRTNQARCTCHGWWSEPWPVVIRLDCCLQLCYSITH